MARSGLTKAQVRATRERLLADGRYPSVDAVRHALGDSGSKSTIHRMLKELREEEPGEGLRRDDTAGALNALVEQLAERLHADAEARIRTLRAEHERALRARDEELAALRRSVAVLEIRLAQAEQRAWPASLDDPLWALHDDAPPAASAGGLHAFADPALNSRSGGLAGSQFSLIGAFAR